MRLLVACEESQAVCKAFRELGHEAYSCDIEPCSGGHPEWHIQVDAIELLKMKWDMILAFPPCTYLSNAGARHLFKGGKLNEERYRKGLQAKTFFLQFLNACAPIFFTVSGTTKFSNAQPSKAASPITSIPLGIFTFFRELQPENSP